MVSSHPEWDDVEDGYENGNTGVFVRPAIVQSGPHGSSHSSGGVPPEEANCYSVSLRTAMGTAGETWDPVANFTDTRKAWEFAHLLTHFFASRHGPRFQKSNLLNDDPMYSGDSESIPDIVKDMTAQETFLKMLHPRPVPEHMTDIVNDGDI